MTAPDLGPLEAVQPLIRQLRDASNIKTNNLAGAYAVGYNRESHECYLFGYDAADREFAYRFSPVEFRIFAGQVNAVLDLLPND